MNNYISGFIYKNRLLSGTNNPGGSVAGSTKVNADSPSSGAKANWVCLDKFSLRYTSVPERNGIRKPSNTN
jgi:hypothetical protein